MRHFSLCLGIVFLGVSCSAVAADAKQKDYAVSLGVGLGGGLSVKKAVGESTWIFANASLSAGKTEGHYTSGGTTANITTNIRNYSMSVGVRQYLANEKLAKFIQLSLAETYTKYLSDAYVSQSSSRSYWATAGYGLEYFLDTDLSVEGTVGLNYTYTPSNSATYSLSNRSVSFPVVGTAITYYW